MGRRFEWMCYDEGVVVIEKTNDRKGERMKQEYVYMTFKELRRMMAVIDKFQDEEKRAIGQGG